MELKSIRAFILDMDGVLWRSGEAIGDLPAIFERLQQDGRKVAFATNNSSTTVQGYVDKLNGFGLSVEPWQIFTSAKATAEYLQNNYPEGSRMHVLGEQGLRDTLTDHGFEIDNLKPDAVVAGIDRHCTYDDLAESALLIRSGVPFIGTNPDKSFPAPQGQLPGAGALLAALEAATDVQPTIIGKPQPTMMLQALEALGTTATETLVVGDRLETDIQSGQTAGCHTCLVLSGVTTEEMAAAWQPAPDLTLPDLNTLSEILVNV
ncbi:MAG: HAD-IIA family hydrolase [Chloroflexi bacterium]|nr:MAG: HAD-IIA family hydrolase [Chloroflexota bacterium]MBL1196095.1 HAD-IIA family hydrolase [Chloroflexota bacterium]NOH13388.1 HAD-IIA family hydrolase [Chloroflexota bacterium]